MSFSRALPLETPRVSTPAYVMSKPTFEAVYSEFFDYVWRSARLLGVSVEEVDDVVQETFLTVYRLLPKYEAREAKSTQSWLYAILFRVVLHHRRTWRRRSANNVESELLDDLADASEHGPEAKAESSEYLQVFAAILTKLDPEKRAVLVLADLEQKSLAEIAEILEVNANTVASRLRTARELIQAEIVRYQARDTRRLK